MKPPKPCTIPKLGPYPLLLTQQFNCPSQDIVESQISSKHISTCWEGTLLGEKQEPLSLDQLGSFHRLLRFEHSRERTYK